MQHAEHSKDDAVISGLTFPAYVLLVMVCLKDKTMQSLNMGTRTGTAVVCDLRCECASGAGWGWPGSCRPHPTAVDHVPAVLAVRAGQPLCPHPPACAADPAAHKLYQVARAMKSDVTGCLELLNAIDRCPEVQE